MTKRYAGLALFYSVAALCSGVFYREFTRFHAYYGETCLSAVHAHYFLLGTFFFLTLMLAEKLFDFTSEKIRQLLPFYRAGLEVTCAGLFLRGTGQVLGLDGESFYSACISGISGLGHILLGVCFVLILLELRKKAG